MAKAQAPLLVTVAVSLAACGGGSGNSAAPPIANPPPIAAPPPAPPPAPSPPPSPFATAEVRRSDGPGFHNAISVWEQGFTGDGVTIGIIDSGLDPSNPEFAGRIHPLSGDVVTGSDSNRGLGDDDGHGTQVALTAAAARDDQGVLGIAFDAQILALRSDTPGSCADTSGPVAESGCAHGSRAIAAGLDRAVEAGARVVNISLGGSPPSGILRDAVARATQAGVVIVVAAGNDGDSTDADLDASNPDPLAAGLVGVGNGLVIIAASVDQDGAFSDFSNRAGLFADATLSALGERICCVYEDGAIQVDDGFVFVVNGTSFSAPQISGAVALLAQAFPNLTGEQIVELLFTAAREAGDPGADAVFGQGILDIAAAFQPQGQVTVAGTSTVLPVGALLGSTSMAMGDAALTGQALTTLVQDRFDRVFQAELGGLQSGQAPSVLAPAVLGQTRSAALAAGRARMAFTLVPDWQGGGLAHPSRMVTLDAEQNRLVAAQMTVSLTPDSRLALGLNSPLRDTGLRDSGLLASGADAAPLLAIASSAAQLGFVVNSDVSALFSQRLGRWSLSAGLEEGQVLSGDASTPGQPRFDSPALQVALPSQANGPGYRRFGVTASRRIGALTAQLGLAQLDEQATVLGAQFSPVLGVSGGTTRFADAALAMQIAPGWSAQARWRRGWTDSRNGVSAAHLTSAAMGFTMARNGVLGSADRLTFGVAQPLRVANGSLSVALPESYDYATQSVTLGQQRLDLVPQGRELIGEMAYATPLGTGWLNANLYYRREPGHFAAAPDDMGFALRYSAGF